MLFENPSLNLKLKDRNVEQNTKIYKKLIEEEHKKDPKYKTELCQKYMQIGKCPYGIKCRFAHGKNELNTKSIGINYKKKLCKRFNQFGFCPYGSRCNFLHNEKKNFNLPFYYIITFIDFIPLNHRLPVFQNFSLFQNQKNFSDKIHSSSTSTKSNGDDDEDLNCKITFLSDKSYNY